MRHIEASAFGKCPFSAIFGAVEALAGTPLGHQSVSGFDMGMEVYVDSSAAKAIASRLGFERSRHLEVRYLWVQGLGDWMKKVGAKCNVADRLTKPLCRVTLGARRRKRRGCGWGGGVGVPMQ